VLLGETFSVGRVEAGRRITGVLQTQSWSKSDVFHEEDRGVAEVKLQRDKHERVFLRKGFRKWRREQEGNGKRPEAGQRF